MGMKDSVIVLEKLDLLTKDLLGKLQVLSQGRSQATIVALRGDLGAGKTTFTQSLAKQLGVIDRVTSPTFVVLKNYGTGHEVFDQLVHIDAYRLENEKDLDVLNWGEYLDSKTNIIVIEWPERVKGALPGDTIWIDFEYKDEETRLIRCDI